jgi:FkbM family methyltransferase
MLLRKVFRKLWYAKGAFRWLDYPLKVRMPEGGIFLAHGDEMGYAVITDTFERNERSALLKLIHSGMIVLDVGANQGYYTLMLSRIVGPSGMVFAFEPAQKEFEKLKRNVLENKLVNVSCENTAIGSQEARVDFFEGPSSMGSYGSLRPLAEEVTMKTRKSSVEMTTLDDFVAGKALQNVHFIKIDVEGGELDVLRGAHHTLEKFKPIIMCEIADVRTKQWGYSAAEIYDFLAVRGYNWFRADQRGFLHPASRKQTYEPDWENLIAIAGKS